MVDAFAKVGVKYEHSERNRSEGYLDALPLFTAGRVRLIDNPRLVAQFASLERRTTSVRDIVDHGPGGRDDCSQRGGAGAVGAGERLSQLRALGRRRSSGLRRPALLFSNRWRPAMAPLTRRIAHDDDDDDAIYDAKYPRLRVSRDGCVPRIDRRDAARVDAAAAPRGI